MNGGLALPRLGCSEGAAATTHFWSDDPALPRLGCVMRARARRRKSFLVEGGLPSSRCCGCVIEAESYHDIDGCAEYTCKHGPNLRHRPSDRVATSTSALSPTLTSRYPASFELETESRYHHRLPVPQMQAFKDSNGGNHVTHRRELLLVKGGLGERRYAVI